MLKDQGVGQQGHSRSASENARALLHVAVHQQHGLSYDAAIKATAAAELASPNTLRDAALQFTTHGTLPSPTTAHRGRGNPEHPLHSPAEPSLEAELLIHRRLEEVKARNLYESSVTLRAALRFELRLDVSERTLLRWLHELGYVYGKKRFVGAVKPACRHVRMRRFILEYAAALQRQLTGDSMLVYTDESYVHDRHCAPMLWFNPSSPTQNEVQGDDSGGKRLMIVHAMTRDGLLETPGAVATNLLTERVPTAELIFQTLGTDDDYHTAMDGDRYLLWLRNRLLPAFDARYPGQRMTLVLDNAGYHQSAARTGSLRRRCRSPSACRSSTTIACAASTRRAAHSQQLHSASATSVPLRRLRAASCRRPCARTSTRTQASTAPRWRS